MNELLLALLTWLNTGSEYRIGADPPNIRLEDPYELCLAYGITGRGACEAAGLAAFYDKRLTIYLRNDFDANDRNDQAGLLHELVHYAQWANGKSRTACLGALEAEAYELQAKWRGEQGLEPGLDGFKQLLLTASCDD